MVELIQIKNPIEPLKDFKSWEFEDGLSFWELLAQAGIKEFPVKLEVSVDGKVVEEKDWDKPIGGCTVYFCNKVEGSVIAAVISIVIAVVAVSITLSQSVPNPVIPVVAEPDPVFSLRGQTNQIKLNEPIESCYGYFRHWPSYASKPYDQYISNESFQYSLYCLTHGHITTPIGFIEDTPLTNFQGVETQLVEPNGEVTLFRDNVQTSSEVSNLELYGPNQAAYTGFFTAVANDAGTQANLISIDVVFPSGLFGQNSSGNLVNQSVTVDFDYREIDNTGLPISSWNSLIYETVTAATVTPIRKTFSSTVPLGRYEVRGRRIDNSLASTSIQDKVVWESLIAFLPNIGEFGELTMFATKIRATANLNDQSSKKFNFTATRKLPIYDLNTQTWSSETATRNPIWAFCDVVRAQYGANLSDDILDLESLVVLANELDSEGITFDNIFDTKITVWEALKTISRSFRGVPLLDGSSKIYIHREKPKPLVNHIVTPDRIVEGSFEMNIDLKKVEEYDSILVEYLDTTTWKVETVLCSFPNVPVVNSETVTLVGVTNRDQAYREGMYMLASKKKRREEITFKTGLEGFHMSYGDRIRVDFPTFGIEGTDSGLVESISFDGSTIELSKKVVLEAGKDYRIFIASNDGYLNTVYTVSTTNATTSTIELASAVDQNVTIYSGSSLPIFMIGEAAAFGKDYDITGLRKLPDEDIVEVTALVYDDSVFDYDSASAPPIGDTGSFYPTPPLPIISGIEIFNIAGSTYRISWNSTAGATQFIVQTADIANAQEDQWVTVAITESTFIELEVLSDNLYVRVAGSNTGQGAWEYAQELISGGVRVTAANANETQFNRVTVSGDRRITLAD